MTQSLVVLAAGLSTRFGSNKQLAPIGPNGEALLDYAVYDAVSAGFTNVTFVIRRALEQDFQRHATLRFGRRIEVEFVFQELDDLPAGSQKPAAREKPWGTAHAILAARDAVKGPFVVINADDFYGANAYATLFRFLEETHNPGPPEFAMIGYRLRQTFSKHGGVSRGICECNDAGFLEHLVEVKKIEQKEGNAAGVTVAGDVFTLTGNETVSMNIWGLTPTVFPMLQKQFSEFLVEHGSDTNAEFLISTALDEQVSAGTSRLKVLSTPDRWFGMTYHADSGIVQRQIAALVEQEVYPGNLTSWFQENE